MLLLLRRANGMEEGDDAGCYANVLSNINERNEWGLAAGDWTDAVQRMAPSPSRDGACLPKLVLEIS
jgi:hypothetical protein